MSPTYTIRRFTGYGTDPEMTPQHETLYKGEFPLELVDDATGATWRLDPILDQDHPALEVTADPCRLGVTFGHGNVVTLHALPLFEPAQV